MPIRSGFLIALSSVVPLAVARHCAGGEGDVIVVNESVPMPVGTLSPEDISPVVSHHPGGEFPKEWTNTPPAPMLVRKGENAGSATYQEARGYTFLVNSMKRPRLVRMDHGRLVLVATAWLHSTGVEEPILLLSDNDGRSWTGPRDLSIWGTLVNLGGRQLMVFGDGGKMIFSDDAGDTWSDPEAFPPLPDGRACYHHGSVVVEGTTVYAVFYADGHNAFLRRSDDSGHTWSEPKFLPRFRIDSEPTPFAASEGALTRAADGALVVALRTGAAPGYALSIYDSWRRIVVARSMDNGETWTDAQVYFKYGKVHSDLVTLPNGDILMAYATRMGELDGEMYHGTEAVLSRDDGRTWDWANRYYLFRWNMHHCMHSVQSVVLADGRIMTVFLYHYDAPNRVRPEELNLGMVDAIFWRAE